MAHSQAILYFGYGSNLWLHQMALRCPSSGYIGVARLPRYRWIINSRGYANIVSSPSAADEVYGLVYALTPTDEAQLDINEGVPYCYTKEIMRAELWAPENRDAVDITAGATGRREADLLVYIDQHRKIEDIPKPEYVHRMNMGVRDALEMGIPKDYIDQVIRKFIPPQDRDLEVQELALKQATNFEDED